MAQAHKECAIAAIAHAHGVARQGLQDVPLLFVGREGKGREGKRSFVRGDGAGVLAALLSWASRFGMKKLWTRSSD